MLGCSQMHKIKKKRKKTRSLNWSNKAVRRRLKRTFFKRSIWLDRSWNGHQSFRYCTVIDIEPSMPLWKIPILCSFGRSNSIYLFVVLSIFSWRSRFERTKNEEVQKDSFNLTMIGCYRNINNIESPKNTFTHLARFTMIVRYEKVGLA